MNLFSVTTLKKIKPSKWPRWLRIIFTVLIVIAVCLAIWMIGPLVGSDFLSKLWVRLLAIGLFVGTIGLITFLRYRKRSRAAADIENALIPQEPEGDGVELAERMQGALATLRKRGGKTYLYDLPWYVIIGPPGAGKTTALANSGIEFPLSGQDGGVVEGFGGTRYCDWWFAEEAILIDTAGRYTTHDSDQKADETSWQAFLGMLKRSRPKQPINGVILAFSAEDMLKSSPEELAAHAQTVRARLAEIHETLRVDFPVYVLFTKADLVAGFREYFSSFSVNRRKRVWGVTFQTKDRKAATHEQVADEFDALVGRLSDEVMDRLSEEPDGISRIAIFGLPGQMAMMRDQISEFMRKVFEPTRYASNAILRGFYFTSGTQEGTPIDQVLGAMSRNDGAAGAAFSPSFMSGKGKSFFLHDLLKDVIFAEQDWVSHDLGAVRRAAALRIAALSVIGAVTIGLLGAFGYSYWQNASLVRTAAAEADAYERAAIQEIEREEISETDLRPIIPYLNQLRNMPAGYGASETRGVSERFGLGQRGRLASATENAYSDALERMFRPRLILDIERQMQQIRDAEDATQIYRALKVYMLLGGQGGRVDDAAIKVWFTEEWRENTFSSVADLTTREALEDHLDAMLTLDDDREIQVDIDENIIKRAREAIVQMPLVDQAYALIMERADLAGLPSFNLVDRTGDQALLVFSTTDGSELSDVSIPAIFTYEGFWGYFFPQLSEVGQRLKDDQWVLGEEANAVDFESQLRRLDRTLQSRYQQDFRAAWQEMFGRISLASMSADKPRYDALGAASSAVASPILRLVKEVSAETKLTREMEDLKNLSPEDMAKVMAGGGDGGGAGGEVAGSVGNSVVARMRSRSSGVQRILFDALTNGNKSQERVNGSSDGMMRPIERIEEDFEEWHLVLEGAPGARPIDAILADLDAIRSNLRLADANPAQSAALLPQLLSNLTRNNSRLPDALERLVNDAEEDFRADARDATLDDMNRALTNQITFNCRENITSVFPFAKSPRQLATTEFGKFFGPGGDMDRFFNEFLASHVERTSDGLTYRADSPLFDRLSPTALKQFDRAERIRRAYFAAGGTQPEVQITVAHVDSHSSVARAQLELNGTNILTQRGDQPKTAVWPGQGASTTLALFPSLDRESSMNFRGGPWTIIQFLRAASSRQSSGNSMRVTYNIGGRSITYDIGVNAVTNPFTMAEISEFRCPSSLD
ncbi:MAG: type VI secretion system protein ImpL [Halocynthiibacter sp.]